MFCLCGTGISLEILYTLNTPSSESDFTVEILQVQKNKAMYKQGNIKI